MRPLPRGTVSEAYALSFAFVLGAGSMLVLALLVNALTAVLTFFSIIGYAVVYTVWLKRATPQNIVIGGAAGAAPPVLGWTAVTGSVDPNALLSSSSYSPGHRRTSGRSRSLAARSTRASASRCCLSRTVSPTPSSSSGTTRCSCPSSPCCRF
jgi:hypothetical protein